MRINRAGWYVPDILLPDEPDPVESQYEECIAQVKAAMPHVKQRELAIQAGGRVGVWPKWLAQSFAKVITLEPDRVNFECLSANVASSPNIVAFDAALGRRKRFAYLAQSSLSTGEHFIMPAPEIGTASDRVEMISVDELMLEEEGRVDAIFLDVEGYELEVLEGARATLIGDRPTLILEENNLCRRYGHNRGSLGKWLKPFGYGYVGEFTKLPPAVQNDGHFRGADLIFKATS